MIYPLHPLYPCELFGWFAWPDINWSKVHNQEVENSQFIHSDGERAMKVMPGIGRFVWSEEGASAVEYSVLAALIAGVVVALIFILGGKVQKAFSDFVTKFANAQ
jgi:pilus assembly protein Flp/PilA